MAPLLPAAPESFGRPVPVPDIHVGQNAKASLGRTRGALYAANRRLSSDRTFYAGVLAGDSEAGGDLADVK